MKLTITSIKLRTPFHFFALSLAALKIMRQLKSSKGLHRSKTFGLWKDHYTMTLWDEEGDLKSFARSGNHLEAMKKSAKLADEIRTLTVDASAFPSWKVAREMILQDGKVIRY